MKSLFARLAASFLFVLCAAHSANADVFLVEKGEPKAEIVIAENPQRSARLAAHDLQTYVKKITGAHLPIVVRPSAGKVSVFVGRSEFTERLKIPTAGLQPGA